jgi:hypothetical protein
MNRRMLIQWACGAGTVVAVSVTLWMLLPSAGINERNFQHITLGMSESEVARILGGPPRDEPGGSDRHFVRRRGERWEIWRGGQFAIAVYFDEDARVVDKDRNPPPDLDEYSFVDKILFLLRLQ